VQLFVHGTRWQQGTELAYEDSYLSLLTGDNAVKHSQGKLVTDPAIQRTILRSKTQQKNVDAVLQYLSDTIVFDTILGNDDRSSRKNSNVYRTSQGVHRFVLIDQGKSFYTEKVVSRFTLAIDGNAENGHGARDRGPGSVLPMCMFRRETVARLKLMVNGRMFLKLKSILPPPIVKHLTEHRLHWAQARADLVLRHVQACVAKYREDVVLPWS
jgi:hypothetical protein